MDHPFTRFKTIGSRQVCPFNSECLLLLSTWSHLVCPRVNVRHSLLLLLDYEIDYGSLSLPFRDLKIQYFSMWPDLSGKVFVSVYWKQVYFMKKHSFILWVMIVYLRSVHNSRLGQHTVFCSHIHKNSTSGL